MEPWQSFRIIVCQEPGPGASLTSGVAPTPIRERILAALAGRRLLLRELASELGCKERWAQINLNPLIAAGLVRKGADRRFYRPVDA